MTEAWLRNDPLFDRPVQFGLTLSVRAGLLWGVMVTTSETLSQPALYLEPLQFFYFYGRILLHYCAGGVVLAVITHWITLKLRGLQAVAAAASAILVASSVSLLIERLSIWYIPVFASDLMLGLTGDYFDLAVYLSWNFAFYGGAYVAAFVLFHRASRMREELRRSDRARLISEASLERAVAQDQSRLLRPSFLVDCVTELGRRYADDLDEGDRLLDLLVPFLRGVMSGLASKSSSLLQEVCLARTHAKLCRELDRPACMIPHGIPEAIFDVKFPPLILIRILDELSEKVAPSAHLSLKISKEAETILSEIACDETIAHALSNSTTWRSGVALRSLCGEGAFIRISDGELGAGSASIIEIAVPQASSSHQSSHPKEYLSC